MSSSHCAHPLPTIPALLTAPQILSTRARKDVAIADIKVQVGGWWAGMEWALRCVLQYTRGAVQTAAVAVGFKVLGAGGAADQG